MHKIDYFSNITSIYTILGEEEEEEPHPPPKGAKKIKGPGGPKGKAAEGNPAECKQQ